MDKFLEWIKKHKKNKALTAKSYKEVYKRKYRRELGDGRTNEELATYGDSVLKLALCQVLWKKKVENLTKEKEKYECDKNLVRVIAKHYDILRYMRYDKANAGIKITYEYDESKPNEKNPSKYIATAIEACLGAMDMDKSVSWQDIQDIVREWIKLIDDSAKASGGK